MAFEFAPTYAYQKECYLLRVNADTKVVGLDLKMRTITRFLALMHCSGVLHTLLCSKKIATPILVTLVTMPTFAHRCMGF